MSNIYDRTDNKSCSSTHTSSSFYRSDKEVTCQASVNGTCFDYSYSIVLGLYILQWLVHLSLLTTCDDFDPQQEMVNIALKYDINSETITSLFHPSNSLLALIFCGAQATAIINADDHYHSYVVCSSEGTVFIESKGVLKMIFVVSVLALDWYEPVAVNALRIFKNDSTDAGSILYSLLKIDLILTSNFLRLMQAFTSPVSVLSYISVQKKERAVVGTKWLNMDVRESFTMYAIAGGEGEGDGSGGSASGVHNKWALMAVVRKLWSRFTVKYSFVKLVASVGVSLFLNGDYNYCSAPNESVTQEQCPSDCHAHCVFKSKVGWDYYPTHSHMCDFITASCYCENWVMTDFLAILFNTLHFVLLPYPL